MRFGRSKLPTSTAGSRRCSWSMMSWRTCSVAVAVKAWNAASGKTVAERGELPVLRAKVVAPVADAVSLVDGEGADAESRAGSPGTARSRSARARRTAAAPGRPAVRGRRTRLSSSVSVESTRRAETPAAVR